MTKASNLPAPPKAQQRPHSYSRHGYTIEDPYFWLKDQGYPKVDDADVLAYLKAENAYFEAAMAPHEQLVTTLFEEMKGRVKEDESSVPARDGDYLYWWAFKPGAQYRTWYRKPVAGGAEQVILDEAAEAEGKEYYRLGALEVSPDGRLGATLVDDNGSERFQLRIRDLATGKDIETVTEVGIGSPVWTSDSKGVVFTEVNDNWRSYRARYHRLGTAVAEDKTLYEETKELGFTVSLSRAQDRSLIFISTGDNATNEVRFVPAANPLAPPTLISARKPKRQYSVDAAHGKLWIVTNDEHVNFRLAEAEPAKPEAWKTVIPGSDRVYLRGATAYRDHLAISERVDGLDQLVLRSYAGKEERIPFKEASYSASFAGNAEFAPAAYRLSYSSMVTPQTVYDYHPSDDRLETLKVQEIPSGYDASQYATERLMLPTRDGKQVPVSIVYRKGFEKNGKGKLFLYAYGAYGYAIPPSFSTSRVSLLDRGYAYAIAHIRGGDDLGYGWFLDGKLDKRTNTFNDFVDAAKGLIAKGYTAPGKIGIQGGSAGGELMGAVANMNPELWGAVVADVPFVDVLNTMQDESLPLTPGEWPEWGNPITDKAAFEYIRSYSPYDQVKRQAYPPMLITGGLNDPRVTYWEPAKWAAKLRDTKTDDNLLLLKINMGAGHGGKSGRWDRLQEVAEAYAFVLTQIGDDTAK
ncbi:S9 family peptidase [Sphingosinicella sp. BN140058]|uniref:S9 family peptidase n=1 Tax=Sphingosinicella sp. BN140058 TaxID=1892855 RepID=UPI0010116FB8|nr:S9 family peptidase [Sphingosinicella sp. BN140058]QAY79872.1 S9 family peptidase [Sphingosinicella sp. BN140058]